MTHAKRSLAAVLLATLAGCADKLPKATEIVHMRILGQKLEVVGDETRTSPKPGEQVRASMITVFPSLKESTAKAQSMFISCTAPTRFTGGLPLCQEFLDAAQGMVDVKSALSIPGKLRCQDLLGPMREFNGVAIQCVDGDPVAEISVAKNFKASQKLLLGVVCERGEAFIEASDPLLFGCDHDDGETIRINSLIRVQQQAADENHSPSLEGLGFKFEVTGDGKWGAFDPSLMPPEEGCLAVAAGDVVPLVDYLQHSLSLSYPAAGREQVKGKPEDLEFSIYATAGKLERRFTLFSGSDKPDKSGQLQSKLTWDPPGKEQLPKVGKAPGKLVRFFITVRDYRGGFDLTTRVACVR